MATKKQPLNSKEPLEKIPKKKPESSKSFIEKPPEKPLKKKPPVNPFLLKVLGKIPLKTQEFPPPQFSSLKSVSHRQARGLDADFHSVPLRFDEAKHCFELDEAQLEEALDEDAAAGWSGVLLFWFFKGVLDGVFIGFIGFLGFLGFYRVVWCFAFLFFLGFFGWCFYRVL